MGLFGGNDSTVQTTFKGKDELTPIVRGMRATMDQFKRDARTGFGLATGFSVMDTAKQAFGFVVGGLNDARKAASDQAEAQSKVNVVFGDSARIISDWAETSDEAMGLSETAALSAAGTLGNLFDSLGLAETASTDMSRGLVQLASDLASFNNTAGGAEEVLVALQSGLLGETEPMRRFGSNLSAARVQAHALATGMARSVSEITDAVKVQARYELILQDTVNAQGDFARTADGAANSQRKLDAKVENLRADLGRLVEGPADMFTDFLSNVVDALDGPEGATLQVNEFVDSLRAARRTIEDIITPMEEWSDVVKTVQTDLADNRWLGQFGKDAQDLARQLRPEEIAGFLSVTGASFSDFVNLARGVWQEFGTGEEALRQLRSAMNQLNMQNFNFLTEAWTDLGDELDPDKPGGPVDSTEETASRLAEAWDDITAAAADRLGALAGITKGELGRARKEARVGMAEITFALKHPMQEAKLEAFYRQQIRRGNRAMHRAQQEGNNIALAKASAFVKDYKSRLNQLRGADLRINTSIDFPLGPPPNPGGPLAGRRNWGRHRDRGGGVNAGGEWENHATGGMASGTFIAGEYGPEAVTIGSAKAHVSTAQATGGGVINLHIDGQRMFTWINGRLAREIAIA